MILYKMYVKLSESFTEEHNKYVEQLMNIICNEEVKKLESSEITVLECVCPIEAVDLVKYLSEIDTINLISKTDLMNYYPGLLPSAADATWEEYCSRFGIIDKELELKRLKELYKTEDQTELMLMIKADYLL